MNLIKGMDVEEVRRLAKDLDSAAEEILRIEKELTSGLDGVDWTGPDADRFRSQWESETVPALQQISEAITGLSTTADANASEQQSTSA
ncbi:WXG100 family type VII secretion target [Brachybacterium sp. AOP25-B2-12]|uniref:WXG100 family type VII secretion target n=1 Tax=Brachybacterium sp. AOP25-B2-12 TaxID=3457710 RepID=UPI004034F1B6